jgi:hypothetical protein
MKKVLEAIRGVVGVSGVLIWDKTTNGFHKLLPARFEGVLATQISERFSQFCASNDKSRKVIARFKKGWVFMHNDPRFALLVIGKADLNTTTLNLVLKSAVMSLESTMRQQMDATDSRIKFLPEHVAALSRAINLSLGFFQGPLSRFEIAEVLRTAKAQLLDEYPALKHFTVDANGGVIIIKKAEKHMDLSAVEAAARLITTFVSLARARTNTAGFDILKLTEALHPVLSELSFYQWFRESQATAMK